MYISSLPIVAIALAAFAGTAAAIEECYDHAEHKYGVPKPLLKAISRVESEFNPLAVNLNSTSYDIGVMQINSQHLAKLSRYGIQAADLYEPCTNIDVGAWILAQSIATHGYSWKAVAHYHSPTPKYQKPYIQKVAKAMENYK